MQSLIARFGGMPATIAKLIFLGIINAIAIWAIPSIISNGAWVMLLVLVAATLSLDYILLTKKFIPAKYVIGGAIFLTIFQLIPIGYTISVAYTNYSTGHIGTKEEAIAALIRDSVAETENSTSYDMLPAFDSGGDLVLILTPQILEDFTDSTDGVVETEPVEEFNAEEFEFGGDESEEIAADPGTDDMSVLESPEASSDAATSVSTYIGSPLGIDEVPPADVQRDDFGYVIGVSGYTNVPEADLASIDTELSSFKVPGPAGGVIVPQGLSSALELSPTLTYDPATDTFTSVDGVVFVDNGQGSFVNQTNPEDELLPGWRENVGFQNFSRIWEDDQIRGPFFAVFIWTFVYAITSVLISFALGLGLAIVLNKPGLRGQKIYRSLLIIPYAVPAFLSVLVWAGLLNDDFAAINQVLGTNIPWLFDPNWAKVSTLIVNVWLGLPYMFLVSTGALQAIPSELQEAAKVDGARNWQVFRLINLPLLLVALTPLLIASFAFNFNNFNNIYLLTGGGPAMEGSEVAGATDILISYTYKIAFAAGKGNDFGLASAISIIIFLIVGAISAISFARSKALREERA